MNSTTAIELITFKLSTNIDNSQFLESNKTITHWLAKQNGYQSRYLSNNSEGLWSDLVLWESMEAAEAASAQFMAAHAESDFMKCIDPDSVNMNHFNVQHSSHGLAKADSADKI